MYIDDNKLLSNNYKIMWTNIEDLENTELKSLSIYYVRYLENKIRTYGDNVYTNFCDLNVAEDGV